MTDVGVPGIVNGVPAAVVLAAPAPTAFTADMRNVYPVEFVRPVTVYRTAWLPVEAIAVAHVDPAFALYSTL